MQTDDIRVSELARVLKVDPKTIHNWTNSGALAHYRTPGRHLRFRREDVAAALRAMGNPVPPALEPFARVPLPERVERVYVAGPSAEVGRCEDIMERVREMGVAITFDWTPTVRGWMGAGCPDYPDETLRVMGAADLAGVAAADVVLLLGPTTPSGTAGSWTEQGAALALRKPVILAAMARPFGPPTQPCSPVFAALCHIVLTDDDALQMLRERAPRRITIATAGVPDVRLTPGADRSATALYKEAVERADQEIALALASPVMAREGAAAPPRIGRDNTPGAARGAVSGPRVIGFDADAAQATPRRSRKGGR